MPPGSGAAPTPRHAREPIDIPAEIEEAWRAGKLEMTCPDCGRWSAATNRCSWCGRPMGWRDFYRNGDAEQRAARIPASAPADPPSEYRDRANWPSCWGPCPYAKDRPSPPEGLAKGHSNEEVEQLAVFGQ